MAESTDPQDQSRFSGKIAKRLAGIFTRPLFASPGKAAPKTADEVATRPGVKFWNGLRKRLIGYPLFIGAIASIGWVDNFVADQQAPYQFTQSVLGQEMQEAQTILDGLPWHTHVAIIDTAAIEAQVANNNVDDLAAAIGAQAADRLPMRAHLMFKYRGTAYQDAAEHLRSDSPVAVNSHVPGLWLGDLPSTGRSDWGGLGLATDKIALVIVNPDVDEFSQYPLRFGNLFSGQHQLSGGLDATIMRQMILWHEIAHALDHNQHFDKDRSAEMRSESFADAFGAIEMIARHGPQPDFFAKLAGLRTTGAFVLLGEAPEGGLGHYTTPVMQAAVAEATRLHESGALQHMDMRQKLELSLRLTNQHAPTEAELERIAEIVTTLNERYEGKGMDMYDTISPFHDRLAADIAASTDARDTEAVQKFFADNAQFRTDWLELKPAFRPDATQPSQSGM